jgi:hypothetical protein
LKPPIHSKSLSFHQAAIVPSESCFSNVGGAAAGTHLKPDQSPLPPSIELAKLQCNIGKVCRRQIPLAIWSKEKMSTTTYKYTKLPTLRDELGNVVPYIRLLRLLPPKDPSNTDETIRCVLSPARLNDVNTTYTAISWCFDRTRC